MIFSAYYSVGTVAVTAGSGSVVGSGTSFVGNVKAGDYLLVAGVLERIAAVVDATHITLARAWSGVTSSGSSYDVMVVLDAVGYQRAVADLLERLLSDEPDGFYTREEVDNLDLNASKLTTGTVPDARLPSRLRELGQYSVITDCNAATKMGVYAIESTGQNKPVATGGYVVTIPKRDDWLIQYFYTQTSDPNNQMVFKRFIAGAGFSSWNRVYEVASEIQSIDLNANRLTSGILGDERLPVRLWPYGENNVPSDANNAQKSGGYMCNPATTNTPFPDWWYLKVEASSGGDIGHRFTRHADGAVWMRRFMSGAWTTPKRLYETAEEIHAAVSLISATAVGSYIFAYHATAGGSWGSPGLTVAGSDLRATNVAGATSTTLSGTWRLMGAGSGNSPSLFLRVA